MDYNNFQNQNNREEDSSWQQNPNPQGAYEQRNSYWQQNPYQQPPYGYQPQPQPPKDPGKGFAIAGMILGIFSIVYPSLISAALGIIFGAVAKSKGSRNGMATAGIICGIVGGAFSVIRYIFFYGALVDLFNQLMSF